MCMNYEVKQFWKLQKTASYILEGDRHQKVKDICNAKIELLRHFFQIVQSLSMKLLKYTKVYFSGAY